MDAYPQQSFNAYGYQASNQSYPQQQSHQNQQQYQQQQQSQPQPDAGGSNYYNLGEFNGYYGYTNGNSGGYANVNANGNGNSNGHATNGQHQSQQHQQQHQQQQQQQYQPQYLQPMHQMQHQQSFTVQPQAIHGNGSIGGHQPYDPFQLGVLTGPGMHFDPVQQQQQYQQYYAPVIATVSQQPTTLDINNIHRPNLKQTISPADSQPGSNASSHRNLHNITPERVATHSPDGQDERISPQPGAMSGPVRNGRQKEGPVKAACLSCRQKKAKCDGVQPVCTQASPLALPQQRALNR